MKPVPGPACVAARPLRTLQTACFHISPEQDWDCEIFTFPTAAASLWVDVLFVITE